MTDALDPRRSPTVDADPASAEDQAYRPDPADDLHGPMGAEAAGIGGSAAGFPAAAIANPDLLAHDDHADPPRGPQHDDDDATGTGTDPEVRR